MTKANKILAIIPARSGSKGLPGKNTKLFGGKELIVWSIEAALNSTCIDTVLVSTDSPDIQKISETHGADAPFLRPKNLSTDQASTMDVIEHALNFVDDFKYLILLQPTSPLRTAHHIDEAFLQMQSVDAPSCVSLSLSRSSPHLMFRIDSHSLISNILPDAPKYSRRQELPDYYELNGAIYIAEIDWLKENKNFISHRTFGYIMDQETSYDIDTLEDFLSAEKQLAN
ncbi:acylneuraminate cytidylyltransferase family protein [Gammaproteobacteria bacterium]|jgi:CMP-N-acetylneuraminic acid synthetase|nr:acylneuraminate cytidylyltransferase family protein [Gammaproteobacteria bacterium]MDA9175247.1 acylneuraminate cytidylyltransferase family protein [Gammaproteobacteria bacterium]MDA9834595.1 acylneuraminate cytidylyltransferase family protein [Gammaproteobacteria bacterium]MDA9979402.1 acylneuraminate cytidylyltransferase family protein [Gammaproteobacteria bacterium]MDC3371989.1 acylneuraminate cytidylyltransferase family protein [Gammaproteobacteria bacterium]